MKWVMLRVLPPGGILRYWIGQKSEESTQARKEYGGAS
jgi:hypothetical protein